MHRVINKTILQHIGQSEIINELLRKIDLKSSELIEVNGASGSGKSYLYKKLCQELDEKEIKYIKYYPSVFDINQFRNIFKLVFNLTDKEFDRVIKQASELETVGKYDFFYQLTEKMRKEKKLHDLVLLIDSGEEIDSYSLDFIQYFIQYSTNRQIKIVVFSTKELFPFSTKEKLEFFNISDILGILQELFNQKEEGLQSQSEILYNLTQGNVYIIEHILNEFYKKEKPKDFNLTGYLDKKINIHMIYKEKLDRLNNQQKDLLKAIFLLDKKSSEETLKQFFSQKGIKIEMAKLKDLKKDLLKEIIIEDTESCCWILKLDCFKEYFFNLDREEKKRFYQYFHGFYTQYDSDQHKLIETYQIKQYLYDKEARLPEEKVLSSVSFYLEQIHDYDNLLDVLHILDKIFKSEKKKVALQLRIGRVNKKLNRYETAGQNLREALQIAGKNKIPLEEIIYELAESLYKMNSYVYALEVIKKYQRSLNDKYWLCKIILLQAEINIELNNDKKAKEFTDQIYQEYENIKDGDKKQIIFAETKKVLGKIYYYTSQWDKAEAAFNEAEKIYSNIKDIAGQAAINNNLGILKMYKGDWKEAEEYYLKSLNLEKKRYNLDGISVCYNNLGGLWEDRGDYKKSLNYFNEALTIKKLLSDRYNICNIYNNIGVTYMDNGEFEKAAEAFEKTLEIAKNFNLLKNLIAVLNNMGALYFKSGKWAKAVECYEEAIEKSNKNNFLEGLCTSYNNLGELYEKRGEYELAYDLYFKATKIIPELNDEYLRAEISGNMGSVLTNLHKFSEAYGYLVESLDFFKALNAHDRIIEGCHKMAYYFIVSRNYESASYYLDLALEKAEEINSIFEIGNTYFLKGQLEHKDAEKAQEYFEKAIKIFVETKNYYELALANYEFATILYENKEWQQALEILNNNKKILKEYGAISLIEKNDLFIQKIEKTFQPEIQESRKQESLLIKFNETTQNLKSITSFDSLLEYALDSFIDLSEADGGIFCLYNSRANPESWEYKLFNHFSNDDKDYDNMMNIVQKTFMENKFQNYKQPHFAADYNNIVAFPLSFHNQVLGVMLLFSKHGSHYFSEQICNLLNALSNQTVVIIENFRHSALSLSHASIREELSSPQIFTNIIGKSEKMQEIFDIIEKVKDVPTTVLLEGESGTGKELIAKAIHYNSVRRNKKFVAQYCGSLPETLLESELFGHVKGSFTGATYDKKGLFEIADGGTFFLDEIADISLSTQAKLLRFLQEGEIKRVGSTKTQTVDVRVICATNVPLKEKIEKGEFRLDLYYRLNVIKIEVPRLSERKSDIPLLAIHFLDKYNKKMVKNIKGITDEAMKYFMDCDWPGNIRQLENEIERAVTLVENDAYIKPSDLSEDIFRHTITEESMSFNENAALKDAIEDLERSMILKALQRNAWNQTQTAKELGLSRQGLIKKIKRYDLEK
ncbi:MAG: sigma 54-interacting transcriptional regulator [Candidatus Cloacimonetes bacterium]|nr:sigma 54-interacting transcriptional regulator [Candidatus Cloacimonadota bacterium]